MKRYYENDDKVVTEVLVVRLPLNGQEQKKRERQNRSTVKKEQLCKRCPERDLRKGSDSNKKREETYLRKTGVNNLQTHKGKR